MKIVTPYKLFLVIITLNVIDVDAQYLNANIEGYTLPDLQFFFESNDTEVGSSQVLPYYSTFFKNTHVQYEIEKISLSDTTGRIIASVFLEKNGFITAYKEDSVSFVFSYSNQFRTIKVEVLIDDFLQKEEYFYYNANQKIDSSKIIEYKKCSLKRNEGCAIIYKIYYECEYDMLGNILKTRVRKEGNASSVLLEEYEYCDNITSIVLPGWSNILPSDTFVLYQQMIDSTINRIPYQNFKILTCLRDKVNNIYWYHCSYDNIDIYSNIVGSPTSTVSSFEMGGKMTTRPNVQDVIILDSSSMSRVRIFAVRQYDVGSLSTKSSSQYKIFTNDRYEYRSYSRVYYTWGNGNLDENETEYTTIKRYNGGLLKKRITSGHVFEYNYKQLDK